MEKRNKELEKQLQDTANTYKELEKKLEDTTQSYNELKQERLLLGDMSETIEDEKKKIEDAQKVLKKQLDENMQKSLEQEQEKLLLQEESKHESKQKELAVKKYYKVIIVSAIAVAVIAGTYSYFFAELAGEKYRVPEISEPTGYTIQNLRGDTIDTWLSWRLVEGDVLHVNILNAQKYEQEKIDAIRKALLEEEMIEIDNSLLHKGPKGTVSPYYVGWVGALKEASKADTQFYVPQKIELVDASQGEGDITIELVDSIHPDGFTGWANSIADEAQNQILKSRITIYNADELTPKQVEAIARHELGHALGLAHSTAPEDLMHPTIETEFPYVSECDIDAIIELYDGSQTSEVTCQS